MNRMDAEQAMEACNEKDPFNVGRQLMMRWGKNVKGRNVKFGSGRMMLPAAVQKNDSHNNDYPDANNIPIDDIDGASTRSHGLPNVIQIGGGEQESWNIAKAEPYQESIHSSEAIADVGVRFTTWDGWVFVDSRNRGKACEQPQCEPRTGSEDSRILCLRFWLKSSDCSARLSSLPYLQRL